MENLGTIQHWIDFALNRFLSRPVPGQTVDQRLCGEEIKERAALTKKKEHKKRKPLFCTDAIQQV